MKINDYFQGRICPSCVLNKKNLMILLKTTVISYQPENINENDVNHTEVIIGSEQGTTFPTKIGTTMCNALIDTGAMRSCMSRKYYKKLHLAKFIYCKIAM